MTRSRQLMVRLSLTVIVGGLLLSLTLGPARRGQSQEPEKPSPAKGKGNASRAWTSEESQSQLALNPRDAYLQYVALQLGRRDNRLQEAEGLVARLIPNAAQERRDRVGRVDLFSIFTGALAVQESLQLDTMRGGAAQPRQPRQPDVAPGEGQPRKAEDRRKEIVDVVTLKGPTIQSHPWEKFLGGKKPTISPLARSVPEDFYLAEFRSFSKLMEVLDLSDLWGTHLFNQASQEARTRAVGERVKKQLAVQMTHSRILADQVIEQVAVTGSDPFLAEGSDITLLFRCKKPDLFKSAMDSMLAKVEAARPDAKRTTGIMLDVPYVRLATPDREVNVYTAFPAPDLHVRSNSEVAFRRVLEAVRGKGTDGKPVRRLGDSLEFAYIRTLMPPGAPEEDGFIYLSDPFIRRLVGPGLKLTERRRMLCYNHLRMINHASLLYRTERGKAPGSLEELAKTGCAPGLFGEGVLKCPDGGKYTLAVDGCTGTCSHHGHSQFLTPCCEIPVAKVTGEEADDYKVFLEDYNRYWRAYFDPIALRVQVTPKQYRLETIVLPLIDNSIYRTLAQAVGGKTEPLDGMPVPKRTIFSTAFRLNKEEMLASFQTGEGFPVARLNDLKEIGLALLNYESAFQSFPTPASADPNGKPLLSWRVQLLPFLEQEALYKEFHLTEPWDSAHNKKLIARMPPVFGKGTKLAQEGKTRYLLPVGKEAMFPGGKGIRIADIHDGTSNTIMAVEAREDQAVIWTKPADLAYNPKKPRAGLVGDDQESFMVAFADGSVHSLRANRIDDKTLAALFTRAGGEPIALTEDMEIRSARVGRWFGIPGLPSQEVDRLHYVEFLSKGIGSQVGLHLYDAEPLFDFDLAAFFGMLMGNFNGSGGGEDLSMVLPVGFLVSALNAPVFISVPVQDAKVVDRFLNELDQLLARQARNAELLGGRFLQLEEDFYHLKQRPGYVVHCFGLKLWAFKWRVFWSRIGNGLYVASKLFVLDDIAALEAERKGGSAAAKEAEPKAHAMVRLRPQNWNQVLQSYRLGWAENSRTACLNNLGPLANVGRAYSTGNGDEPQAVKPRPEVVREADKLYGVQFFCPENGEYMLTPDGKTCACSVHGTVLAPTQMLAPGEKSATGKLLRTFGGLTATLTFLEDGLHAVVTIERK